MKTLIIVLALLCTFQCLNLFVTGYVSKHEIPELREKARAMFYHAYTNYMTHAYPADELKPLSCTGRWRMPTGHKDNRGTLDDGLGQFSLTLVDALDTLAVMGDFTEFENAVHHVLRDVRFDNDVMVSVFETTIRVLGGLLSGHVLAVKFLNQTYPPPEFNRTLLDMAIDLGNRLLPAFNTPSKIPYSRVNLRHGVPRGESTLTCLAGAGTLLMEFGVLSRLSGNPIYEKVADDTVRALWEKRSRITNLPGGTVDVYAGQYVGDLTTGIGAGSDSFYEYLLKSYILFGEPDYLDMFNKSYDAIKRYVKQGNWYLDVHMHSGAVIDHKIDSLQAFWPALQVLSGDIDDAIELHSTFYGLWRRYGFLPEYFHVKRKGVVKGMYSGYPLRPEFAESTFLLYRATRDNHYLEVGKHIMKNLQNTRVACGFAAVADVETMRLEDRMDSFFLSETCKYLYLLFDEENEFANSLDFLFTTEGHILPIYPPRSLQEKANITTEGKKGGKQRQQATTNKRSEKGDGEAEGADTKNRVKGTGLKASQPKCEWAPTSISDEFRGMCSLNERKSSLQDHRRIIQPEEIYGSAQELQQQMLLNNGNIFSVNAWGQSVTILTPSSTSNLVTYLHVAVPTTTTTSTTTQKGGEEEEEEKHQETLKPSDSYPEFGFQTEKELQELKKWRLRSLAKKWLELEGKGKNTLAALRSKEELIDYIISAQDTWLEKKRERDEREKAKQTTTKEQPQEEKEKGVRVGGCQAEEEQQQQQVSVEDWGCDECQGKNNNDNKKMERKAKTASYKISLAQFGPSMVDALGGQTVELVDLHTKACKKEELLQKVSQLGGNEGKEAKSKMTGRVVLIDRGDCSFAEKVTLIIQTMPGVLGVLIADHTEGPLFSMTGQGKDPSAMASALITRRDATALRNLLKESPDGVLNMYLEAAAFLESDQVLGPGGAVSFTQMQTAGVDVMGLIQNFFAQEFGCMGHDCAQHVQKDTVFMVNLIPQPPVTNPPTLPEHEQQQLQQQEEENREETP